MADISSITLPNGETYNLKDTVARSQSGSTLVLDNIASLSSLPATIQNGSITEKHVVVEFYLSNENAQLNEWGVTTYDGYYVVSGSISGSTSLRILFGVPVNT